MRARVFLGLMVLVAFVVVLPAVANGTKESAATGTNAVQVNKTGFPIVNKKITLTMMGARAGNQVDWNQMILWKWYENKTNIHVNWINVPASQVKEKLQLTFASGNLPDAFYGMYLTPQQEIQYGGNGTLIPLEKLYKEWAPNIEAYLNSSPAIRKTYTTPSGHIYTFPSGTDRTVFLNAYNFINTKWLKKLGLAMPKTTDQFYKVLQAFKTEDPNGNGKADEIPLAIRDNNTTDDLWALGEWFGIPSTQGDKVYVNDNNKVEYVPINPRFKAEVQWFHNAWENGLLDPKMFTQTWQGMTAQGEDKSAELFGSFMLATIAWTVGFDRANDYTVLPALQNPYGTTVVTGTTVNSKGRFSITKADPYPAATVRWIDFFASVPGAMDVQLGPEGQYWKYTDPQTGEWVGLKPNSQSNADNVTPKNGTYVPFINFNKITTTEQFPKGTVNWMAPVYAGIDKYLNPYRRVPFPDAYMTLAQVNAIAPIESQANTYIEHMVASFITGDTPMSQWDKYVATLNKMGAGKLVQIYQQVYDAYNK